MGGHGGIWTRFHYRDHGAPCNRRSQEKLALRQTIYAAAENKIKVIVPNYFNCSHPKVILIGSINYLVTKSNIQLPPIMYDVMVRADFDSH